MLRGTGARSQCEELLERLARPQPPAARRARLRGGAPRACGAGRRRGARARCCARRAAGPWRRPSPGPHRRAFGRPARATSSKKTSQNSSRPWIASMGRTVMPGESMSTNSAVMPRCAESAPPVRVSSTHRCAYWAKLVQTFWPVTRQPVVGAGRRAGKRGEVAARARLREPLAPGLVAPQQPRHHLGRQLGRGVVDHRRRQHLGHRVHAGVDEATRRERLAEVAAQQGRATEAADPLGPAPAHPAGVVGQALDRRQVRHLVVERRRHAREQLRLVLVEPAVEPKTELVELHQPPVDVGAGRVGSCGRPESATPLLRRKVIDRVCRRQPSGVRRYVSVYQPMRMSWVVCSTKHSGC